MQIIKWDKRNPTTKICIKENHTKIINCKINHFDGIIGQKEWIIHRKLPGKGIERS